MVNIYLLAVSFSADKKISCFETVPEANYLGNVKCCYFYFISLRLLLSVKTKKKKKGINSNLLKDIWLVLD